MSVILGKRRTTRVRHEFTADDVPFQPSGWADPIYVLVTVRVDAEVSDPDGDRGHVEIVSRELRDFNASVQANGDGSLPDGLLRLIRERHEDELIELCLATIGDVDVDHALLCEAGQ